MAKPDIQIAYESLSAKQSHYTELWNYYDGRQRLKYSAERLESIFSRINTRFTENWCAVVVDSVLDRLQIERFAIDGDDTLTQRANELYVETEMKLDDDDAHLAALVCGEAAVIAWRDDGEPVEAYYNDPRQVHVEYDPDHPKRMLWAAKWWVDADEKRRLTLYYADRVEHWISTKKADQVQSYKGLVPAKDKGASHQFGRVPVFHLRRERRAIRSELDNAIPPQDAINKLLSDMIVAAEFGAFPQRWIISNGEEGQLKNAPNEVWPLQAAPAGEQPTSAGQFPAVDLSNYLEAIDKLATTLGVITKTPKHYFYAQAGDPSGEALLTMEAPLIKKTKRYIDRFSLTWRRFMAFLLKLDSGVDIDPADIEVIYAPPETVQPRTRAEIVQMETNAGWPLKTALREQGYSDDWLDQMSKDKEEQTASGMASFGALQAEMERRSQNLTDSA